MTFCLECRAATHGKYCSQCGTPTAVSPMQCNPAAPGSARAKSTFSAPHSMWLQAAKITGAVLLGLAVYAVPVFGAVTVVIFLIALGQRYKRNAISQ